MLYQGVDIVAHLTAFALPVVRPRQERMRGFAHQHYAGKTAPVRRRIRVIVNEYGRRVAVFLTLSQQHGRRDGGVFLRHKPQTVGEDERQQRRGNESAGVPETPAGAPGQHEIETAQEGRPGHARPLGRYGHLVQGVLCDVISGRPEPCQNRCSQRQGKQNDGGCQENGAGVYFCGGVTEAEEFMQAHHQQEKTQRHV